MIYLSRLKKPFIKNRYLYPILTLELTDIKESKK